MRVDRYAEGAPVNLSYVTGQLSLPASDVGQIHRTGGTDSGVECQSEVSGDMVVGAAAGCR